MVRCQLLSIRSHISRIYHKYVYVLICVTLRLLTLVCRLHGICCPVIIHTSHPDIYFYFHEFLVHSHFSLSRYCCFTRYAMRDDNFTNFPIPMRMNGMYCSIRNWDYLLCANVYMRCSFSPWFSTTFFLLSSALSLWYLLRFHLFPSSREPFENTEISYTVFVARCRCLLLLLFAHSQFFLRFIMNFYFSFSPIQRVFRQFYGTSFIFLQLYKYRVSKLNIQ